MKIIIIIMKMIVVVIIIVMIDYRLQGNINIFTYTHKNKK